MKKNYLWSILKSIFEIMFITIPLSRKILHHPNGHHRRHCPPRGVEDFELQLFENLHLHRRYLFSSLRQLSLPMQSLRN